MIRALAAPARLAALIALATVGLTGPALAGSARVEGNFSLQGDIRRDGDAELFGPTDPQPEITGRNSGWAHNDGRSLELRLFGYPVPSIEVFAKVFATNDWFFDEAHTRYRVERGGGGLETYLYYSQGRLDVGDPIQSLRIVQADGHEGGDVRGGAATNFWMPRGRLTLDSGQWSGEINFQSTGSNFNAANEDNEIYAGKLRHDYRFSNDLSIALEGLYTRKNFSESPVVRDRRYNQVAGADLTIQWKAANVAFEWLSSEIGNEGFGTPDNEAVGVDIKNVTLFERDRLGRIGFNGLYLDWERNYTNTVGGPDPKQIVSVTGGNQALLGRNADGLDYVFLGDFLPDTTTHREVRIPLQRWREGQIYWDLPYVQANIAVKYIRKDAMRAILNGNLERPFASEEWEADGRLGLVKGFELRTLFRSITLGAEPFLLDFGQNRFIESPSNRQRDLFVDLTMRRNWGHLRVGYRRLRPYGRYTSQVGAAELNYKVTDRITLLTRHMLFFIDRPENNYAVTGRPAELGGGIVSYTDLYHRRAFHFAQLAIKPTDNSQIYLEYGNGFAGDFELARDDDIQRPRTRTDDRIFAKLEMWF